MAILDRSGITGPPAGLSLTALLAFHLAIDDEQYAFYNAKPIFSHIGTGEILPPVRGQKGMKLRGPEGHSQPIPTGFCARQIFREAHLWHERCRLCGSGYYSLIPGFRRLK
ncbi:hypothetical protein ABVK25_010995 [Lepraria finkii]|uniref:Uncharacterized protein n=1 Tax=Lepraria finkii TaxID=1340010 RepID=A0ABR4AZ21_9LECA